MDLREEASLLHTEHGRVQDGAVDDADDLRAQLGRGGVDGERAAEVALLAAVSEQAGAAPLLRQHLVARRRDRGPIRAVVGGVVVAEAQRPAAAGRLHVAVGVERRHARVEPVGIDRVQAVAHRQALGQDLRAVRAHRAPAADLGLDGGAGVVAVVAAAQDVRVGVVVRVVVHLAVAVVVEAIAARNSAGMERLVRVVTVGVGRDEPRRLAALVDRNLRRAGPVRPVVVDVPHGTARLVGRAVAVVVLAVAGLCRARVDLRVDVAAIAPARRELVAVHVKALVLLGVGDVVQCRDAVGADAKEHRVGKADDAGVAQQQVVAGHQHDEDQDLGGHIERLGARKDEGRQRQAQQAGDQQRRQQPAAREVVGEEATDHERPRAGPPQGRPAPPRGAVNEVNVGAIISLPRGRGPAAARAGWPPSARCSRTAPLLAQ